jgi:hypothetical protein
MLLTYGSVGHLTRSMVLWSPTRMLPIGIRTAFTALFLALFDCVFNQLFGIRHLGIEPSNPEERRVTTSLSSQTSPDG